MLIQKRFKQINANNLLLKTNIQNHINKLTQFNPIIKVGIILNLQLINVLSSGQLVVLNKINFLNGVVKLLWIQSLTFIDIKFLKNFSCIISPLSFWTIILISTFFNLFKPKISGGRSINYSWIIYAWISIIFYRFMINNLIVYYIFNFMLLWLIAYYDFFMVVVIHLLICFKLTFLS